VKTPGVFTHSRSIRVALSGTFIALAGVALLSAFSRTVLAGEAAPVGLMLALIISLLVQLSTIQAQLFSSRVRR